MATLSSKLSPSGVASSAQGALADTALQPSDLPPDLTQVQVEDDTSTVFGQVSGQRLAQAFNASQQQVGVGQTFQDVASIRVPNIGYLNTLGRPIYVFVELSQSTSNFFQVSNDGVSWIEIQRGDGGAPMGVGTIVPDGLYYSVIGNFGEWMELR